MKKFFLTALPVFSAMLLVGVQFASAQQGKPTAPPPPPATGAEGAISARSISSMPMPIETEMSPETVLKRNPALGPKLQPLLPSDITPGQASSGYTDINHFVTAVHASHDLGIPFVQLKCMELGGKYCSPETKAKSKNLENAILLLKPSMDKNAAKQSTKTAEHESKADLKGVNIF